MNIPGVGGLISKLLPSVERIVDDLHTSGEERAQAKQKIQELLVSAEQEAQKEVTARWNADLKSDSWLPKNIRPLTLAFLTGMFVILSVFDGNIGGFTVNASYAPVYQNLLMVVYGAYFAGRSLEKVKRTSSND
jgi:hypothetical protein